MKNLLSTFILYKCLMKTIHTDLVEKYNRNSGKLHIKIHKIKNGFLCDLIFKIF